MVESGFAKYSVTNFDGENNDYISFKNDKKISNSNELLDFVAKSFNFPSAWLNKPKNTDCLKNVYKYADLGETENEKTSMCRIAELARYHKLKHEYVLFDESGPAHMKCFTVKLILCPEQEFVGTGPSIKKAQQSAAGVALQNTTLTFPPQRIKRSKRDELDLVVLFKQVVSQLNITAEFKNSQVIRISNNNSNENLNSINNNASLVQSPIASISVDSAYNFKNISPLYSKPPPTIITSQCSKNLSPLFNYSFKFLNTNNNYKKFPYNQINKNSYLSIPQRQNFNINKGYQIYAQPNYITSQNCINNFSLNFDLHFSNYYNFSLIFGYPNNCDKNINLLQQIYQYQQNYNNCLTNDKIFSNNILSLIFQNGFSHISNLTNHPTYNNQSLIPIQQSNQILTPKLSPIKNDNNSVILNNNNNNNKKNSIINNKNETKEVFQIWLELSDGSKHIGFGINKANAKSNAVIQALKHLRPLLEKLQANIKSVNEQLETNEKKQKNLNEKDTNILSNNNNNNNKSEKKLLNTDEIKPYIDYLNNWIECDENLSNEKLKKLQKFKNENFSEINETVCKQKNKIKINNQNFTNSNKKRKKSIVSMIHECAFQLRMNVEFEMLKEEGEPHNRQFTVRCRLTSPKTLEVIEAEGQGQSKKAAKQNVCQIIYEKIKEIDIDTLYLASMIVKNSKKNSLYKQSKTNKRKIIVKQRRSDPQYGHWINPVSRLMQVMQANNLPEPIFKLISEQGQNCSKEFVIEVKCFNDICEKGVGQNKKLAKRTAAEAMLRRIGFIKPMPEPGKTQSFDVFDSTNSTNLNFSSDNESTKDLNKKLSSFTNLNSINFELKNNNKTIENFNDVKNLIQINEQKTSKNALNHLENFNNNNNNTTINQNLENNNFCNNQSQTTNKNNSNIIQNKRRVTFSNQVSACPSPDDATYPISYIAPLKSEVLLVNNKLKKRGRDSKKNLTIEERKAVRLITQSYLSHLNNQTSFTNFQPINLHKTSFINTNETASNQIFQSAKQFLDMIAQIHKFSVVFSDFPKTQHSLNDNQCFSLVTLGIDKPIVCPGSGNNEENAHEDAALNAIKKLSQLSDF